MKKSLTLTFLVSVFGVPLAAQAQQRQSLCGLFSPIKAFCSEKPVQRTGRISRFVGRSEDNTPLDLKTVSHHQIVPKVFHAPLPFSNQRPASMRLSDQEFIEAVQKLEQCNEVQQTATMVSCKLFVEQWDVTEASFACLENRICVKKIIIDTWCAGRNLKWDLGEDMRTCE